MIYFLAIVLVVMLGLYIWERIQGSRLREKITEAKANAALARTQYEEKAAQLFKENQKALSEAEKSLNEEIDSIQQEKERFRQHYQSEANRIHSELSAALADARSQLEVLGQFKDLAQDESSARAMITIALQEATALRSQAEAVLADSRLRSSAERDIAVQKSQEIRQQADAMLSRATAQAHQLIQAAHKKAEEIGGDAYTALRDKEHLDQAVIAIRNVIEGYGDRYIVPTRSLLDDLAAALGHTEAGQELAAAREQKRRMIEQGLAGECDYAERNRRDTAIRFVVAAFDGRVEEVLSRSKHDNFGTLEREIRDAFSLVNLDGEAFRNARIQPAFLDACLLELKWAVVVHELKLREREEQRRIREQIREEERARKEYEKVMREAQREEDILKEALEKARHEIETASAGQRVQFEQQMAELSQRLLEAEAKNQRALSMAQQTRKGNVYIISNVGSFGEGAFKIGMTRRLEPLDRVYELSDASVPFDFDVHAIIPSDDAPALEYALHSAFADLRINQVNLRKEFFRVPLDRIREFATERGIEASFTMTAEAHEFRESQVISAMAPELRSQYRLSRLEELDE